MYVLRMAAEQAGAPDWESLSPGPELAALLERETLSQVADGQIVEVLRAVSRQLSHLHAMWWAAMVEVGRREPARKPVAGLDRAARAYAELDSWHWATQQIGAALTLSRRRADVEYGLARQLVGELPLVWEALSAGRIDPAKAKVFAGYLANLTADQIELICRRLVPRAPGWTTGQLAHRLLREILAIDPGYARRRYEKAVQERGVCGYLAEDGTAVLTAHGLHPTEAAAAAERLEQLAAAVRAAGHPHTEAQLRADLFVRLLDGRYAGFSRDQIVAAMLADVHRDADPRTQTPASADRPSRPGGAGSATGAPARHGAGPVAGATRYGRRGQRPLPGPAGTGDAGRTDAEGAGVDPGVGPDKTVNDSGGPVVDAGGAAEAAGRPVEGDRVRCGGASRAGHAARPERAPR